LRAALVELLGADAIREGDAALPYQYDEARLQRLVGHADAVVAPRDAGDVAKLVAWCCAEGVPLVPRGGGTGLAGGAVPIDGGVVCSVERLNRVLTFEPELWRLHVDAGVTTAKVQGLARDNGLFYPPDPGAAEQSQIGGNIATNAGGPHAFKYGPTGAWVTGLEVVLPPGELVTLGGPIRKESAGYDLKGLLVGSEGTLGVITEVTLRAHRVPAERVYDGWRFATFDEGTTALRRLVQDGPVPTVLRLSDEAETAVNLADPGGPASAGGALAIAGYEGTAREVATRRAAASAVLADGGGRPLGVAPGEAWREGRYRAPYLRDQLLDAGALVETLETATFWSNLAALRAAVTAALSQALAGQGTAPVVLCHLSHVYRTGASLYFTVVCAQAQDPIAQWHEAKTAANAAIRAAGATITHHHGVGTVHRDTYQEEIGPLAVAALRAVKATLDPAGILNPGVLV